MRTKSLVHHVDNVGRLFLPHEILKSANINKSDAMEIYVEEDKIILEKYHPSCIFCHNTDNIIEYRGKEICPDCLGALRNSK